MRLRKDLQLRKVGNDFIIVEPGKGKVDMSKVYTFNETAVWLWEELQNADFDAVSIRELLQQRFDISPEASSSEAKTIISLFETRNLIEQ